jgi:acyl dehydratase
MRATRELSRAPGTLGLSLRAAAALLPGASVLPFIAGGGHEMPNLTLALDGARLDAGRLADYRRVCGFASRSTLPATAPHLLAFPLHMALMTDGSFPFPAVGLVHLGNRITVHRPIPVAATLSLRVRATPLEPHAKGRTFTIVSEARIAEELVWEEHSTMLRRGSSQAVSGDGGDDGAAERTEGAPTATPVAEWQLQEDLGRRYAAVSGDRNPIHMHALSARLFGFPKAIAHGMWTKARCLAALDAELPDAYTVEVAFRRPILLPARVAFAQAREREQTSFAVRAAQDPTTIHLEGTVTP